MILTVTFKTDEGEAIGSLVLNPKVFTTGSRGYFGMGKAVIGGKRFQVQCQAVEIGSKPDPGQPKRG